MRIAFYPAQSGKPWDGGTLEKEALGGSESAVIYMARELARIGHEVTVFTQGEPDVYDDVLYLPQKMARSYFYTTPLDVLICVRDQMPLLWQHRAAMTIIWCHDIINAPLLDASFYFFVSNWHATQYVQVAPQHQPKIRVSPNGIDTKLFPNRFPIRELTEGDEPRLVWTSNPERGLWYAGQVLQLVRRAFPKATLTTFGRSNVYGWGDCYEHVFYPDSMDGVFVAHSMHKAGLSTTLTDYDLMVYPTWWPETFCIATLEAQAAGVPVVCSALAALPETVQGGLLVSGSARDAGHIEDFANQTIDLLRDQVVRQMLADKGHEFAHGLAWSTLARHWSNVFSGALGLAA